jgi:hypothetical protein
MALKQFILRTTTRKTPRHWVRVRNVRSHRVRAQEAEAARIKDGGGGL